MQYIGFAAQIIVALGIPPKRAAPAAAMLILSLAAAFL